MTLEDFNAAKPGDRVRAFVCGVSHPCVIVAKHDDELLTLRPVRKIPFMSGEPFKWFAASCYMAAVEPAAAG